MITRTLMSGKVARRSARAFALAALTGSAALAAGGAAHADSIDISWSSTYLISASYDAQNVAVAGGSSSPGTRIIQWPTDDGAEQEWRFGNVIDNGQDIGTLIQNGGTGMCITTDGNAGDGVYEEECEATAASELFDVSGSLGSYDSIYNISNGLYLDVSGYSGNEGANIDLWYWNGQGNQSFVTVPF
ncbi:RICIN domain-containing protein [Actinospica durhamensis]|uniref:RICIN domain-containing protein n=1 Tax=Actinospica durhamensis TaxID=1508375 RepID=A0A941EW29_9ACTN|nr:RICIN domain-containing protein [Actinospica durhamensis]MBR7839330.1 RICIN domain-containing protein [Actinospica durhamensis]